MQTSMITVGDRSGTGGSAGLEELGAAELEAVEGGLLFLAGALIGLGTCILVGVAIFR